jgi:hypothetical protein
MCGIICTIVAVASIGCVSPRSHVGTWEHEDKEFFVRVVFERDGICSIVMGGTATGGREGIGGRCHYSQTERTISITDISEIDDAEPREKLPAPFVLRYEAETDTIAFSSSEKPMRLVRTSR